MEDDEYSAYLLRAQFFNASGRTLDGLHGMMFRKPVITTVPDNLMPYLENVDGKGHTLNQFINESARDVHITGWGGVLVDMPQAENVISQKDFEENGLYAYMTFYRAEDIINWKFITDGRRKKLAYVIFKEETEVDNGNYSVDVKNYYRVCEIDEEGYYKQTLYSDSMQVVSEAYPSGKNGRFREIPFTFLSAKSEPEEPMLLDLINVNLSHYRKSADLENGAHWTGVPTPYASGVAPETEMVNGEEVAKPLKLGGSKVLFFPEGGSLNYLEFSGQGCSLLRQMMADDENRMAILGARIISQETKGVESAETAKIHRAGENSVLAEFALSLSICFKKLLKIYLEWSAGVELAYDEISLEINTDYDVATMNPSELTALVSLWQSGGIAKSDLFENLKYGEIVASNRNFEDMQAEISEEQIAKGGMLGITE